MRTDLTRCWMVFFVGLGLVALAAGCSEPGGSEAKVERLASGDAAGLRLSDQTVADVQPAARRAFKAVFPIDTGRSEGSVLVSRPVEADASGSRVLRDKVSLTKVRHRHVAQLELIPQGSDVVVRCRVQIQRLETTERSSFADLRGDDRPDTPIDRYGAASAESRQDWVAVGRDRKAEQQILAEIDSEVTGVSTK